MTEVRLSLIVALLAAAGLWHWADKSRGIDEALNSLRNEYTAAALSASERARATEKTLVANNQKVAYAFQLEKSRRAADAVLTAGKLSELQAALDRVASADPATGARINGPAFAVASECAASLVQLDEYAQGLAGQIRGLQSYVLDVSLAHAIFVD